LTPARRWELGIENLPASLEEALRELAADEVVKNVLGPRIYEKFREVKQKEWDEYRSQVYQWEIDRYLTKY